MCDPFTQTRNVSNSLLFCFRDSDSDLQRTSAPSKDAARTSVVTITSDSTCAYTRAKASASFPATHKRLNQNSSIFPIFSSRPHPSSSALFSLCLKFFYHLASSFISCFVFFVSFAVYSTWAQVSLGHCTSTMGAGTAFLL